MPRRGRAGRAAGRPDVRVRGVRGRRLGEHVSAPEIPPGALPTCLWCEREERSTGRPRMCRHLAGAPVDRPGWFARELRRAVRPGRYPGEDDDAENPEDPAIALQCVTGKVDEARARNDRVEASDAARKHVRSPRDH